MLNYKDFNKKYPDKDYREYIHKYLNNMENCILVSCDMFPYFKDRKYKLIDIGLRESSVINFAIGLALNGSKVFVYCPLNYIKFRSYEQIKLIKNYNIDLTLIENYYNNPHNLKGSESDS